MNGARDVARVLDSRVRRMLDGVQPQPPGAWADRVPDIRLRRDLDRYLRELAEAMDDRARRLGEHAAQTQPPWALRALGPVPDDPAERADWEQRASVVASYRERYGHAHPADPIGPEPGKTSPEARAAWHAAMAALGQVDGIDLRGCTDGELWLRRGTYERETAWAPPHVAEELRLMRIAERDAHVNAVRAEHETAAAADEQTAARHRQLAGIWRALEAKAAQEADMFAAVQDTRRAMGSSHRTDPPDRHRRRHRTTPPPPEHADRAAAPAPRRSGRRHLPRHPRRSADDVWIQVTLDGSPHLAEDVRPRQHRRTSPPPARQREAAGQLALGLTPDTADDEIPEQVLRIRENARIAQAKLDELASTRAARRPSEDDLSPGPGWPAITGPDRDAVLQPPQPDVVPSARVLEHQATQHRCRPC